MATQTWERPAPKPGFGINRVHVLLVLVAIPVLFHGAVSVLRSPLANFYITVDELAARGGSNQAVRVGGDVVPGSIDWDNRTGTLSFDIRGDSRTLHVLYRGYAPDALKDQATAIVEGTKNPDGTFLAGAVLVKCPHQYQAI